MTHDELLAIVIGTSINVANSFPEIIEEHLSPQRKALRAVVELHKPVGNSWNKVVNCRQCKSTEDEYNENYPCPTIQAIEKELNDGLCRNN